MPDPDELARLRAAVEGLSSRLDRLEQQQSGNISASVGPGAPAAPDESRLGLKVINRIGALTLAIGVIFFFKYAVDENLIGAGAGVLLGIFFGLSLIGGGEWLIKRDQRVFAQGVSGCGLATIYISVYASFAFYQLLSQPLGFLALAVVSGLAVGLSIRYRNPAIAALGFIGAVLTPMLLQNAKAEVWPGFPYLLLIAMTAIAIAIRQRWAILIPIVAPLTILTAWILLEPKHGTWVAFFAVCLSVLHFGAMLFTDTIAPARNSLYVMGHSALLLAALRFLDLTMGQKSIVQELDSVLLAGYGIGMLAYGLLRTTSVDRIFGLVLLAIVIAKLYLVDLWVLARIYRITAFVGLGVLLLAASYVYSRSDKRPESHPH